MRWLVQVRQALASSPLGVPVRALKLQRVLDRIYEPVVTLRGTLPMRLGDRILKFRVTNKAEANALLDCVGETDHIRKLCADLRPDDVVYDVGASIGLFSCWAAAIGGAGVKVHSFEPEPRTADRLAENARLNQLNNVFVHSIALSDTEGSFELSVHGAIGVGTHSLLKDHAPHAQRSGVVKVRVCPALDYAREAGIDPPTVAKIDVEGAEAGVLRGMRPWLESGRIRRLDVEFHRATLKAQGESETALERGIVALGYTAGDRSERNDTLNVTFIRNT